MRSEKIHEMSNKSRYKATPIKCLDLGDTSGQLKLKGCLYIVFIFYALYNEVVPFLGSLGEEAPFYGGRGWFIGNFGEKASFY